MNIRKCTKCGEQKLESDFYKTKKKHSDGEEYYYIIPSCKECMKKKSAKWKKENPEKKRESYTKYNHRPDRIEKTRENSKKRRLQGKHKQWLIQNPDKLYVYGKKRRESKTHSFTDEQWQNCLSFFNNSCAYCGMTEKQHLKTYEQRLHKEHVEHDGSNDIDNCVPSCKSCNSSKFTHTMEIWYKTQPYFDEKRLAQIWLWIDLCKKMHK